MIGIDLADIDDFVYFGNHQIGRQRNYRIEVPCRPFVHQVACGIGLFRLDDRDIGTQRDFQQIFPA